MFDRTGVSTTVTRPPKSPVAGLSADRSLPRDHPRSDTADSIHNIWASFLSALQINEATCVINPQRRHGRRVYRQGDSVLKVEVKGEDKKSHEYRNDLSAEWQLLEQVAGIRGVVEGEGFFEGDGWHAIRIVFYDGWPLDEARIKLNHLPRVFAILFFSLYSLSMRGVSHNDVMPRNVLVSDRGVPLLLDFDQASRHSRVIAIYRNFIGFGWSDNRPYGSFLTLVVLSMVMRLPAGLYDRLRTAFSRQDRHGREVERRRLGGATGDQSA